jgi:hypothetical protein
VTGTVLVPAEGDGSESFGRIEEPHSPPVEVGDCCMIRLLCATLELAKFKLVPEASE